jgi:cytochrome P450
LHAKYGPVVRVGPTDLSYATSQAWKDIYGGRAGGELAKHPREYSVKTIADHIIIADATNHARFRRSMAPAFSDRALREQEPLITKYVDLLVARLGKAAESEEATDMVGWYNCATFDLVGDLAFGEPFGCLEEGRYHPWVKMIFDSLKMVNLALCTAYFPLLNKALMNLAPASVKKMQEKHIALTKDKVKRRVDVGTDRPDFLSFILRHKDESRMSYVELEANSEILIIAGGETTATALSGATYYLLKTPRVMEKLVREVRGKFSGEAEINSTTVGQLKYLQAVIEETLRMYPPAPINLNRITPPQGAMVCGKWVAGGVSRCCL